VGIARTVFVLGNLLSLLAAQQQKLRVRIEAELARQALVEIEASAFRLPELGRYDTDLPEGAQTSMERLPSLLERTVGPSSKTEVGRLARRDVRDHILFVYSSKAEIAEVRSVVDQLKKEAPLHAHLQFSLVTLPWSVAQAHNLENGRVVAVDAEEVGKLMREATQNKGTLCNLPEVTAGPLAPFVVSPRRVDAKEAETLRLRGEMLPIDDREVAVAMHLVRGALPMDRTREPAGALLQPVFRLQAGKYALATVVEGETATVLIVRCVDVAAKAPPAPVGR
jgi:hypothetical protein